jgi:hypothetical protein
MTALEPATAAQWIGYVRMSTWDQNEKRQLEARFWTEGSGHRVVLRQPTAEGGVVSLGGLDCEELERNVPAQVFIAEAVDLQAWRTVTIYVLRDTLDAAGITVTAPEHPWGIATVAANGKTCEPLLCEVPRLLLSRGLLGGSQFARALVGFYLAVYRALTAITGQSASSRMR